MADRSDLSMFRNGLNAHPDDPRARGEFADFLQEHCGDESRAAVLRLADMIRERIGHVGRFVFPDQFGPFWTPSLGWEAVADRLETLLAECPKDAAIRRFPEYAAAFRASYERTVRGHVPLDPEHVELTLRLQYDLQVGLLASLNLLEEEGGNRFITAIDGGRHPIPAFGDVLARMQAPEMRERIRQGFDTLLLVPFGLPLERFLDAWREGLRRKAVALRRAGSGLGNEPDPLVVWAEYHVEPLVYEPRSFTPTSNGGRTKAALLAETGRAWDVLLVEGALPNLPRQGQERTIGGRTQLACNRTPIRYDTDLRSRGESGQTPESYVVQFLDALERQGQVLDVETGVCLTGAYLEAVQMVPCAFRAGGRMALGGRFPSYNYPQYGMRSAVRVI